MNMRSLFLSLVVFVFSVSGAHAKSIDIVTSKGQTITFNVQTAVNPQERNNGLMWVDKLPEDRGMLFAFPQERIIVFWMKNTLIPLDIIYIQEDGEIVTVREMAKPHDLSPLSSRRPVKFALEIAGGTAKKRGISAGDKVILKDSLKGLEIK